MCDCERIVRVEDESQYVRPSTISLASVDATISSPARASVTVSPDHQAKSCSWAGPWLVK